MTTPGCEPQIALAVLAEPNAPAKEVVVRLSRGVNGGVLFRHPQLTCQPPNDWVPMPAWTLLRTPHRLVGLMLTTLYSNNLSDIAWHLPQTDAALLVVRGSAPGTPRDLLVLAAHRGLGGVIVFLDTMNVGEDTADRVERELRLTLLLAGFPGDDVPIVRGEVGDDTAIDALWTVIDHHLATPRFDEEGPARFVVRAAGPADEATRNAWRGRVERGTLERGEVYHAHWGESIWPVWVEQLNRFEAGLDRAAAGQNLEVVASPQSGPRDNLHKIGAVVGAAGTVRLTTRFNARMTFFRPNEGGRGRYVMNGFTPSFLLPATRRKARIELLDRLRAEPGETFPIAATFRDQKPGLAEAGDHFVVRDNGRLVGHGVVE